MIRSDERGFTLVEAMVAILLLSILSIGFYQVMLSAVQGSNDASDISQIAEEARLGLNRMIRDTREATKLIAADGDSYRIWTDFNGNDVVDASEYEYMEYAFNGSRLTLTALTAPPAGDPDLISGSEGTLAGTETETVAANIVGPATPFSYTSNFLVFDNNANGETSVAEIEANTLGSDNGQLLGTELDYVSDINYSIEVRVGDNLQARTFHGQAQIRNRRYSDL